MLDALGASKFDLIVIDYSADGTADGEFSSDQIAALKNGSGGPKTVLAYMSIGEAETYRFYWDRAWTNAQGRLTAQAPAWLAAQDPNWHGNFKVRYWLPDWQAIIFGTASGEKKSYLDRVMDAGFDGVYLDIIDAFEYFGPGGHSPERPAAATDMVNFVAAIADYARTTRGNSSFIVVSQNGSGIVRNVDSDTLAKYFGAVDAIASEDTFFYGARDNNNAWRPQNWTLQDLAVFQANSKPVFAVDYVTTAAKMRRFYKAAQERGFVPFVSVRSLDRVLENHVQQPE